MPIASTRKRARRSFDNWPVFNSGMIIFLNLLNISPVLSGNGFTWVKWVLATLMPFELSRLTACVIPPYVDPQPTTRVSEDISPFNSSWSISFAIFSIFHALISVIYWWLSVSYETLPVPSSFSRPPILCSKPGVPGIAHGRAFVWKSLKNGKNPSSVLYLVVRFVPSSLRLSISGSFHGSEPVAT